MADGINIPITGDASKFLRETDDVEKALDDVADALDDAAKESKDAGRDGEKSFRDLTREVKDTERQTDKLTDSFDDARRKARDVGDDGARGLGKVKEGAQEVQQEIGQNLGEAVSSIRGDLSDLGQVGQDTLGGLAATVASMGPAGLAGAFALAAGATGLGAITAGLEDAEERQQRLNEEAGKWADKFIESGQRIATAGQQAAEVMNIYTDPDRYKEAKDQAELWGVGVETAVLAMAGNTTSIQAVTDAVDAQGEAAKQAAIEAQKVAEANGSALLAITPQEQAYNRAKDALEGLTGAQAEGRNRADALSRSLLQIIDDAEGATVQVDQFGNKLITLPDDTQVVINADTGRASQNIDDFKGDVDEIPKQKAVTVKGTVDLSAVTRGIRNYRPPTIRVNVKPVGPFGRSAG